MNESNAARHPEATSLREAFALQARHGGRHPHIIMVKDYGAGNERYHVVTQLEAQRLSAQGFEPLWLSA